MGCRSLVSFMTLASIHSSHTHCFCSHGSSTLQFQHVARLILMFAKKCFLCQLRSYWAQLHVQRTTLRALIVAYLWWHRSVFFGLSYLLCAGLASCLASVAVLLGPAPLTTWLHAGLATCLASVAVLLGPASSATYYFASVGGGILVVTSLHILGCILSRAT